MFIAKSYLWWYTAGWGLFVQKVKTTLLNITDFFSMNSLIRTLFKPFRQISADSTTTSSALDIRFQMFIDRLVSRIIGFFVRFILLILGCIFIIVTSVFGLTLIILWPFIPLAPIAGFILTTSGVTL